MVTKYALLSLAPLTIAFAGVLIFVPFSSALISGQDSTLIIIFGLIGLIFALAISYLSLWFNFAYIHAVNAKITNNTDENIRLSTSATHSIVWRGFLGVILSGIYIAAPFIISLLLIGLSQATGLSTRGFFGSTASKLVYIAAIYGFIHAIYYSIRLNMFLYGIIIDGHKIRTSLHYSMTLVRGRWWEFFIRIFLLVLTIVFIGKLTNQIGSYLPPQGSIYIVYTGFASAVNLLISQFAVIFLVTLYNSSKNSKV
jgi:hypothetical protein